LGAIRVVALMVISFSHHAGVLSLFD
jgi:hypothetical protein